MIKKWWYGETLLGGKPEHIYIIEKELISLSSHFPSACVKYMNDHSNFYVSFAEHNLPYDEAVLQMMRRIAYFTVPKEELQLSNEDNKHRTIGAKDYKCSCKKIIVREV